MSVESSVSKVAFTGNNSTVTPYNVPFRVDNATDLVVVARLTATGVETTLAGGQFTVSGLGNPAGCTVTTAVAWPNTYTLTFYREVAATQLTSYTNNDSFPAASHERALDKLTYLMQQALRKLSQCFRVTEASTTPTEKPSIPLSVLGLDGAGQLVFRSSQEMVSFLSLTAPLVDNPVATWQDAAERAVKVPDFLGQLGLERSTLKVYHSTGVAAGNWVSSQADPSDLSVTTGKIVTQAVTNGKLAHIASGTLKGRTSAGTGDVQDITVSDALETLPIQSGGRILVRNQTSSGWGALVAPVLTAPFKSRYLKHTCNSANEVYFKEEFVPFGTIGAASLIGLVINTVIPLDDTPPLITEGQEVANYSSATDYGANGVLGASASRNEGDPFAVVSFSCPVAASAVSNIVVSVFRVIDGGAPTLVYAAPFTAPLASNRMVVAFSFFDQLNSVSVNGSTVSYSVRMGVTTGTATIGGIAGGLLGSLQRTLFSVQIYQR
jgi:hypothetical protein